MKISASKKQLAKSIHENGGWRDGAGFAAQDQNATVTFFVDAPWRCGVLWEASEYEAISCIALTGFAHTNWHQTILSREEYFHLYPAPDDDGWIDWKGGECPVAEDVVVDVKTRDGEIDFDVAYYWNWSHEQGSCVQPRQITAYRLHKPEQPKSTAVGDDETNLAAKEELEALEFEPIKPTIEQLAADYKAKLATARRAQEEADSHRCGAEAALEKLYQAGLAIGLDIAIADSEQEGENQSELVITDWRDLRLGDEIATNSGRKLTVKALRMHDESWPIYADDNNGSDYWCVSAHDWRFIRRP